MLEELRNDFSQAEVSASAEEVEPSMSDEPENAETPWLVPGAMSASSRPVTGSSSSSTDLQQASTRIATAAKPEEALSSQNVTQSATLAMYAPENKLATTADGRPCAHYRRRNPSMNTIKDSRAEMAGVPDNLGPYSGAEAVVLQWLRLRPGLLEVFIH